MTKARHRLETGRSKVEEYYIQYDGLWCMCSNGMVANERGGDIIQGQMDGTETRNSLHEPYKGKKRKRNENKQYRELQKE
ncbi:hypothetical protein AG1IA_03315 [Rhizoctonia solani AG-1 IA]|uniref:Uncharacterized protein n=1 Tax=Thanatephorus cucumeris (strain AG1-IA) TaxID=983506 RepID=L8WXD8_THACA|nr:hypothetical protein AG1IA_03315 [Rhizoctonia solani AG-1 IA]